MWEGHDTLMRRRFLFIAIEGYLFIVPTLLAAIISYAAGLPFLGLFFLLCAMFCAFFFRDPEREASSKDGLLSPADGRVVEIKDQVMLDHSLFKGEFKKLAIFMSVANVHVNRAPVKGVIIGTEHKSGRFLPADREEASLSNENNTVIIEDGSLKQRILVKQIAGILARRISCWVKTGDEVQRGQRFGMIKFGSRVEVFVPKTCEFTVGLGDKVRSGETVICRQK